MIEILDNKLKIFVLVNQDNPDVYYLSYQSSSKCVIDTTYNGNNVIISPVPQGDCTVEELNIIIDRFSNYIFRVKPEIDGILLKVDSNPLLESIGFKEFEENSEYLYKENKRMNKVK